jgi:hypothetical protein
VPLSKLLPTKKLPGVVKASAKYQTVASSESEVGLIEPIIVHRQSGGTYLILDGHARYEVLKDRGVSETLCIVSSDDEAFTYNRHVSHMSPIQKNRMITRALDAGVHEGRMAKALNLARNTVHMTHTLLNGICPEAVELLKDKPVVAMTFRILKKVKPLRQIEMSELMIAMANYSKAYALGLLAATPPHNLLDSVAPTNMKGLRPEDLAKMQAEMQALEREVLGLDESYGRNLVNLTIARGYLKKVLENAKVVRYLASKYPDLLAEFQRIQEAASLDA